MQFYAVGMPDYHPEFPGAGEFRLVFVEVRACHLHQEGGGGHA